MERNLSEMLCLDIYLSSKSGKKNDKIKNKIKPSEFKIMPLISWDIYSVNYLKTLKSLKAERDIEWVKAFAKKAKWKNEIDSIFNNNDFDALIITDSDQKILWVNDGFTTMTGYSKTFALDKTPRFLQGTNTLPKAKERIRNKLNELKPFTAVITNYRKDKSQYECEVKIIPISGEKANYYLAIEKQIG